ncbi:GntR family transcriptional regulator [Geomicrobium sediminis]|uniref:DNA-binding GntR family transcriptional regulator n=1 Tax=Geomicrobium sediminis TaxID=1347788 RepID=A0ABS2P7Q3_9BACL|nr:GntR family transcriptional regulator [Geomicrobium sediminis]MBM7631347.1 DNA-binding GntR family transcriptional regulator [Geomicrobium sediminis]
MNTTFNHVKPLYEQAYDLVKRLILYGKIAPGEKVIVAKLADDLNISRTPLREAFRQLLKEQLVTVDRNGVLRVIDLEFDDLDALYDCRKITEKEFIANITTSISDANLLRIEQQIDYAKRLSNEQPDECIEFFVNVYSILIDACTNRRLAQLVQSVHSLLLIYVAPTIRESFTERIAEQEQLLFAMQSRDESKAIQAITSIIESERNRGIVYLNERSLDT